MSRWDAHRQQTKGMPPPPPPQGRPWRYRCDRCGLRYQIAWTRDRTYTVDLGCTNRPWRDQPTRRCPGTLQPETPCTKCYPPERTNP